ncbi:MAG: hypothetical protein WCF84_11130 [Anaerolineae bacterium]
MLNEFANADFWLTVAEFALIVTTFLITTRQSIHGTIRWYRIQCLFVALASALTAWNRRMQGDISSLLFMILLLPLLLFLGIKSVLELATVQPDQPESVRGIWRKLHPFSSEHRDLVTRVNQIWNDASKESLPSRKDLIWFFLLLGAAFFIAYFLVPGRATEDMDKKIGLGVSLSLHLIGFYNMNLARKRDIISQIIGLLMMDHGLYLAVVKIVGIPVPAGYFVTALYFYTGITMVILFFMIPRISRLFGTINLDKIAQKSNLSEYKKKSAKPEPLKGEA